MRFEKGERAAMVAALFLYRVSVLGCAFVGLVKVADEAVSLAREWSA